jgi:hypothetical protein
MWCTAVPIWKLVRAAPGWLRLWLLCATAPAAIVI